MAVDTDKLMEFVGSAIGDLGATLAAGGVVIGHRLGLYTALAQGPATPEQLAERTGCHPRYLTEWLRSQAAGGYVSYDPDDRQFAMSEEQAFALTDPAGPVYLPGAFLLALASLRSEPRITEAFRTGAGVGWHEHHEDLFTGCELFFRPGYLANLTTELDPRARRRRGEAGRRRHASPTSAAGWGVQPADGAGLPARVDRRVGLPRRVDRAGPQGAVEAGVGDRVQFEVASAQTFAGSGYDLVTSFDCLHDMGDPLGAARHVRAALAPDGTWMVVEPAAGDRVEDNLNPVGRVYYSALDVPLRAERAVPAGRLRARRAGGRGGDPAAGHRRRVHPVPAGGRDPVQHRLRGPSLGERCGRGNPTSRASSSGTGCGSATSPRRRGPDRPAPPVLGDPARAALEGAGAVPGPPVPGDHDGGPGQRPGGPPDRRRGLPRRGVRRGRRGGAGHGRGVGGVRLRPVRGRAVRPAAGRPAPGPGARCDHPGARYPAASWPDFHQPRASYEGWQKANKHYWLADYRGWAEFFFTQVFTEPHSLKQREDGVAWALGTDAETLLLTGRDTAHGNTPADAEAVCRQVRCPVLVVHGDRDAVVPYQAAVALAGWTGAELVTLGGSGHAPTLRDPVRVNLLIRDFVERVAGGRRPPTTWTRPRSRRRRALFVCSPIGLGHVRRDLAIADELRLLRPDLEIDWLTQDPVPRPVAGACAMVRERVPVAAPMQSWMVPERVAATPIHSVRAARTVPVPVPERVRAAPTATAAALMVPVRVTAGVKEERIQPAGVTADRIQQAAAMRRAVGSLSAALPVERPPRRWTQRPRLHHRPGSSQGYRCERHDAELLGQHAQSDAGEQPGPDTPPQRRSIATSRRSTATTTSASPSTTTNAAPIPMIVVSGDPYTRTQNASLHDPLFTSMWYQPTPMSLMSLMCNTSVNR